MVGVMIGLELAVDAAPIVEALPRPRPADQRHAGHRDPAAAGADPQRRRTRRRLRHPGRRPPKLFAPGVRSVITMRHLVTLCDVTAAEVARIFAHHRGPQDEVRRRGCASRCLPGRTLALLFEKQSLRTRVSFEAGMAHLGGTSLMLGDDVGFGNRESIADFTRVLSEMVDVIVVRAKAHATVEEVASHASLLGHQRPDRRVAPLPGAGRPVHDARAVRHARRAQAGLGRRRQQRGPQPRPRLRPHGRRVRRGHAPGYEFDAELRRASSQANSRS